MIYRNWSTFNTRNITISRVVDLLFSVFRSILKMSAANQDETVVLRVVSAKSMMNRIRPKMMPANRNKVDHLFTLWVYVKVFFLIAEYS